LAPDRPDIRATQQEEAMPHIAQHPGTVLPPTAATTVRAIGRVRTRHDALRFVAASYAITWLIWLPLAIDPTLAFPESPWRFLYYLGFLGPLLAAVIVAGRTDGRRGPAMLAQELRPRWRRAPWIALGAALPLAIWFGAVVIARVVFATTQPPLFLLGGWVDLPGFGTLAGWLFILATVGVGAEVGWRGFLLAHLQRTRGAVEATALVTLAWAAWHIPLFYLDPTYRGLTPNGIGVWLIALLGTSTVLTWLFNRSRGSTLACALFHGATTSIWMSWAVAEPIGWGMGALIVLLGMVLSWRIRSGPRVAWGP
jgi:CAAX protease family protein